MKKNSLDAPFIVLVLLLTALAPSTARAQFSIDWYTIDGGGGTSSGGGFEVVGTIGQHDAGPANTGGSFQLVGGFWGAFTQGGCPADIDGNGVLNIFDFLAYQTAFSNNDPRADMDGNGTLNIFDFLAYQTAFGVGC